MGKRGFFSIFDFSVTALSLLLVQEEDLLLVQVESLLLAQEEELLLSQEENKE